MFLQGKMEGKAMGAFVLGTVGFLLCFVYDINSITWKNSILQRAFAAGSVCVVISVIWALKESLGNRAVHPAFFAALGAGSLAFLGLLIYTLFFALPFQETYVEKSKERMAYTEGVYCLCRHPGVLWFAGAYICLWGMTGDLSRGFYFLSMILWNCLYIVVQDFWIFPVTFTNYETYKRNTPFLFPNRESMKAFMMWKAERKQ